MKSNRQLSLYTNIINDLHSDWVPHEGQIKIGRALFNDNSRRLFIQCGRKFGKTEICIYMLWRWALMNPASSCYYISPFAKQSKEIVWANRRLQNFGPRTYVKSINNSELRINFKNGSFIKCDGSDNFEAYRGITPHFVLYDEFKDFRPEFHVAMSPNLAVNNAPLVIIGTPPDRECQYVQMAKEYQENDDCTYFQFSSYMNPHLDKDWLNNERGLLERRGEFDVWQREYMAKFVPGGVNAIFPMLSRDIVMNHKLLLNEIRNDRKKLQYYCVADPGTTTCFAVLFGAINPYNKRIYLLDEIYETDQKKTSVNQIGRKILDKRHGIWPRPDDWVFVADEAAAWFMNEMADRFDIGFMPTKKSLNKKDVGLSLIKDTILQQKLVISSNCKKMYWEMENYIRDKNNNIPKMDDHLIDSLRYLLDIAGYSLNDEKEPDDIEWSNRETKRFYTPEEDWKAENIDPWRDDDISDY